MSGLTAAAMAELQKLQKMKIMMSLQNGNESDNEDLHSNTGNNNHSDNRTTLDLFFYTVLSNTVSSSPITCHFYSSCSLLPNFLLPFCRVFVTFWTVLYYTIYLLIFCCRDIEPFFFFKAKREDSTAKTLAVYCVAVEVWNWSGMMGVKLST